MSVIWVFMLIAALLWGAATGRGDAVGSAAMEGAAAAAEFCIGTGALICLWSGVMEVLRASGAAASLSRLLRPILRLLFPRASRDGETMEALSMNVSANLLGLGNAATPMGLRAAEGMARLGREGEASDELCLLVVINTASIQLLPTTIAAVRAQCGAAAPFDILPAVWIASAASVLAGILGAKLCARLSRLWTR
ncbi:MAG: nucleoside recognition domain-containing protein [Oscillospiraceae bacterium]